MPIKLENISLLPGDRASIRRQLINRFINEEPGTGRGELTSYYTYTVEIFSDGSKLLIKRPARLNWGMDFTVNLDSQLFPKNRFKDQPKHDDVISDLLIKKQFDEVEYQKIKALISTIYSHTCLSPVDCKDISINVGLPVEKTLMILKWLFIEQDVTYWNVSGRRKLYEALEIKGLC